jgi:hypothetical protein
MYQENSSQEPGGGALVTKSPRSTKEIWETAHYDEFQNFSAGTIMAVKSDRSSIAMAWFGVSIWRDDPFYRVRNKKMKCWGFSAILLQLIS